MSNDQTPEIACNMGALAPDERETHMTNVETVFKAVIATRELEDGYAFRLPLDAPMLHKTTEWMANERLCCPFFTFTLIVNEEFWLELTGPAEIKDELIGMIDTLREMGSFVPDKAEWIVGHVNKLENEK